MKQLLYSFIIAYLLCGIVKAQDIIPSSTLPIVIIHTGEEKILDDPRIPAHLGIIYNGSGMVNTSSDPFNEYDGQISMEIRGSSSQFFAKKSYAIETQTQSGENNNVSILGMPSENDWILYGPYSDKSLMRNRLTFELAADLTVYAPRTKFIELIISDNFIPDRYQGIYVWMEKIKRDKGRVDIAKLTKEESSPEDISGGYIIKLDKSTGSGGEGWTTQAGSFFQYHYPDQEEINAAQRRYIQSYIDELEVALYGPQYQDPEVGYRAYVDPLSFVDFILINELTKNVDGYRLSTFFHKDKGGKLHAGPIWDFNLALGNANYCGGNRTDGWALNFNYLCPGDFWQINPWWDRLLSDPWFGQLLINRWRQLRQGPWHTDSINAHIATYQGMLEGPAARNFEKWPVLDKWVWPNVHVLRSYPAEVDYLRSWVNERLTWLDANIQDMSADVRGPWTSIKMDFAPNPFSDQLRITVNSSQHTDFQLQIFNLAGQEVFSLDQEVQPGYDIIYTWDGRSPSQQILPRGLYVYRFTVSGWAREGKLIKQ